MVSQSSLEDNVPGLPGEDYPTLASPPDTSFSCADKVGGGYYADTEAGCQGESDLDLFNGELYLSPETDNVDITVSATTAHTLMVFKEALKVSFSEHSTHM